MDNNNDNISIIGDFIDAQTDYITSKTRYEGLRNDYRVASEHAARLQELHGLHPESKAIAANLQHRRACQRGNPTALQSHLIGD